MPAFIGCWATLWTLPVSSEPPACLAEDSSTASQLHWLKIGEGVWGNGHYVPAGVSETLICRPPMWISYIKQGPQFEATHLGYCSLVLCLFQILCGYICSPKAHSIASSLALVICEREFLIWWIIALINVIHGASIFVILSSTAHFLWKMQARHWSLERTLNLRTRRLGSQSNVTSCCCSISLSLILLLCNLGRAMIALPLIPSLPYKKY